MKTISLFSLLRKGIYPYDCRDIWEKVNKNTLPKKKVLIAT